VRMCKGKSKVHPGTDHEGPEREYRYNCTLSLTSALEGVGGKRHALAALTPGKIRYPLYRVLLWTGLDRGENSRPPADRPTRSESICRLSYPGPLSETIKKVQQSRYRPGVAQRVPGI